MNEYSDDMHKAAGIIIKDRKLLVERSYGKPTFIAPGGGIEAGETAEQALIRELKEELSIEVSPADFEPFGTFTAEASNHPGRTVRSQVFLVRRWRGEIIADSEVEEFRWLTSELPKDITVGSIVAHEIVPRLKASGLID